MSKFPQPEKLMGKYVNLREITVEDAEFVLKLRCDEKKAKFLHKTDYNIEKQIDYIKKYLKTKDDRYFIIENKKHEPLGTLRMYNIEGDTFTSGSWLMKAGSTPQEVLEGVILLKNYAFFVLGFQRELCDVRKENKKVVRFDTMVLEENDVDYFFECTKEDFINSKEKLYSMLGE